MKELSRSEKECISGGCKFFVLPLYVVDTKFEAIIGLLNNVTSQQKLLFKREGIWGN
jgi:hypothetical protein